MDNWAHYKTIVVNKDINGLCITDDDVIYLAIGRASNGGLAYRSLHDDGGSWTTVNSGTPQRQVCYHQPTDIVVASDKKHISTFQAKTGAPSGIYNPGIDSWGISVKPDGQAIVSDPLTKTIYAMGDNYSNKTPIITKKLSPKLKSTWSVIADDERVYISDRKKRQVICHTIQGTYQWRVKLGRPFKNYREMAQGKVDTEYMGGMCLLTDGSLLVCDTTNDELVMISSTGEVLSRFRDSQEGKGLIEEPTFAACNSQYACILTNSTLIDSTIQVYKTGDKTTEL